VALSYAVSGFEDLSVTVAIGAVYGWGARRQALPARPRHRASRLRSQPDADDNQKTARPPEELAAAARELEGAWDS